MNATIHIVCSSQRGVGKTFLSRICGDILLLTDCKLTVFDMAFPEEPLSRWFPKNTITVDFRKVREQTNLFDTILRVPPQNYVIDVNVEYLEKFFLIMNEIEFFNEINKFGIDIGIYYVRNEIDEDNAIIEWIRRYLLKGSLTIVNRKGKVTAPTKWSVNPNAVLNDHYRQTVMPQLSNDTLAFVQMQNFKFGRYYAGTVVEMTDAARLELALFMERLLEWSAHANWNKALAL